MFTLEFETDDAPFDPNPDLEVAYILRHVADQVENGFRDANVRTTFGNTVGKWELTED